MSASKDQVDKGETPGADMRLPGSVAEIMASPAGAKIGAFFDLDGTLVAGFTAVILTQERLLRRDMGVGELLGMVQAGLSHTLGRIEFEDLIGKAAAALTGRLLDDLEEIGERLFVQRIESRIYPEMRELVRAHVARGHTVVLSSSALTIQVNPVARFLGIPNMLTNKFETTEDGMLTGSVKKPILWGPGKAAAVQRFAAEHSIDLKDSYFYADGDEDVALMYLVGNPRPTNPEGKMAAVAKRRGWPILRFSSRGPVGLRRQVRTLAGLGSIVPVGAGAVAMGVLTGSRRRGANFFTSIFSQTVLATTGVRLNVVGKENLTAQRPAVFIYNHRNQVDPVITGALVNDNWVAVAKKELQKNPIMALLGKALDGVFIDRDDSASALETMRTVEERARNGLSIVMAPEGTRLDTTGVGPLQKRAIPSRDGRRHPDRSDRDPQCRAGCRPELDRHQPGHRRHRGLSADLGAGLDTRHAAGTHRRGAPTLPGHARQLARRRTSRGRPVRRGGGRQGPAKKAAAKKAPAKKAPAKKAPAKKAPAKKAPAKKAPAKKAPAKKAAAKKAAAKKAPAKKAAAKKAPAKKAPAKKAAAKKAPAKKAAPKAKPPKANPHESQVALQDGELQRPAPEAGAVSAEPPESAPRGHP